MSNTLKVIHECDHLVSKKIVTAVEKEVTRSSEEYDQITDHSIESVSHVTYDGKTYFRDVHFKVFTANRIKWISASVVTPPTDAVYTVFFREARRTLTGYDVQDCPRCGGMGWYVSMAPSGEKSISLVSGAEKMAQDFVKILLTDSRFYSPGTSIKSMIGTPGKSTSEIENLLKVYVKDAESKLKQMQYSVSIAGGTLPPEEILKMAQVSVLASDESSDTFYVEVFLVSDARIEVAIGFEI